jgi:hypothetical protein
MKEEQAFSAWLRTKLPGHVVRIENTIGAGIPDISYCSKQTGDVWIETKIVRNGQVKLEKEQYAWGMRRTLCGGKVFVVALDADIVEVYRFPFAIVQSGKYLAIDELPLIQVKKKDFQSSLLA